MNTDKAAQAAKVMLSMAKQHEINQEAKLPDYDSALDDNNSTELSND